jgi:tetraacyldisaccharide 4'-kinase
MMLSSLYGAVVGARNALYDRGSLPARRLGRPVVSVGNISVGGAGKTPFVIALGELLKARGIAFDVLSRGYRRATKGVRVVDPAGLPGEFGDEPLLIARKLQVPVVVGEDRYDAGVEAEKRFPSRLHLLDDGFQHRQLARDFDIALVTPEDARETLLPRGRLREPLSALSRADAVVLAAGADPQSFPAAKTFWRIRRGIVAENVPPRPVAFCGIARPQSFFLQLKKAGIEPAGEAVFRDHHPYTEKDVHDLLHLAQKSEAGGFVTTEKDAVNLGGLFSALNPLAVVPVRMELLDAGAAIDLMLATVAQRRGSY